MHRYRIELVSLAKKAAAFFRMSRSIVTRLSLRRSSRRLDRVTQWLRLVGYVHCSPGFGENAFVVNGVSDLVVDLWGDAGRHTRSAPGQGPSPLNVPIIIDAIVAIS